MKRKAAFAAAMAVLLSACANGFTDYYRGLTREQVVERVGARAEVDPKIVYTNDFKSDAEHLVENGFMFIGESAFQAPESRRAEANAVAQGKAIGAEIILLNERDAGSRTVSVPITTPTTTTSYSSFSGSSFNPSFGTTNVLGSGTTTSYGTSTSYVPMTVHRVSYDAAYWAKGKPPIFGVNFLPLTPEQHRAIGTNSGVMVQVVMIGSPAFKADIFKGDYLMAIGGEPINTAEDFQAATRRYAGTQVDVQILRDGQRITKSVRLGDAH